MKEYLYSLLRRYISVYARPDDQILELDNPKGCLMQGTAQVSCGMLADADSRDAPFDADYILLNGSLHYIRDIQAYLESLHEMMSRESRLIITYYSLLWRPFLTIATHLGWRDHAPEANWLSHEDIANLLYVSGYETVRIDNRILLPLPVPILSNVINRFIAPLPVFRWFALVNILVARPIKNAGAGAGQVPSVSIVVPARNEAGNISAILERLPRMGPHDELIFVEGGSTDETWARIQAIEAEQGPTLKVVAAQQDGKGKGDAVRKGFSLATREILMILDADLTVPPEDLPKFYRAIVADKGEFINGSRLVYPMEPEAMRFLNLIGNKFFALGFSFVLGQRFRDTLCGTKVLTRATYETLSAHRAYFGDFDPFGDFDLIFGAARMGLRITEIPITYQPRTYGTTNISRWAHGWLLLRMLGFASTRLKFI
jgi:hypothetical protein